MPWYFTKDTEGEPRPDREARLVDCVTASAAAPTYFDPFEIRDEITLPDGRRERIGALIDGGVGTAGNPVYQACVEAFVYTDDYRPEETTVVSLGTGHFLDRRRPSWIWAWLNWLLAELLRSPGEQQTELVHRHYSRRHLLPDRHDPEAGHPDGRLGRDRRAARVRRAAGGDGRLGRHPRGAARCRPSASARTTRSRGSTR